MFQVKIVKLVIFTLISCCLFLAACNDQAPPPGTAEDYQRQFLSCDDQRQKISAEKNECEQQLAMLTGPGGRDIGEERKILARRYAELERREKKVVEKEVENDQKAQYLEEEEKKFYEATHMSVEEIGEAKQIKKDYELMKSEKIAAEQSRDNYLFGVSFLFVVILAFIGYLFHQRTKYKELEIRSLEKRSSIKHLDN